MAKTLKKFPQRPHSIYPWGQWSDGQIWRATRGADFDCAPEVFRATIRAWAYRHDMRATTSVDGDNVTFQICAATPELATA